MKKTPIIIVVALLLLSIAILPIVGNKFMQKYIQDATSQVNQYGLKLKSMKTDTTYLDTKKHFVFVVEDSGEFINYINTHTHNQVPLVTKSNLDGTVFGLDLKYSNIPFAKSINFDVYPLELSKKLSDSLKTEDINFYNQLSAFLDAKGLLYHLDYNLISSKFKGYVKDINESYKLHNGSDITLKLLGAKFKGKGDLLSAKRIDLKIGMMQFEASQNGEHALLFLKNFKQKSNFVSLYDYKSVLKFKKMRFLVDGTPKDINIFVGKFLTSSMATTDKKGVTIKSHTAFNAFYVNSKQLILNVKKFNGDISVKGVAQKALENISNLFTTRSNIKAIAGQKKMQEAIAKLLEKGFKVDISDISLADVVVNDKENYGGLKMKLNMRVNKDANVLQKLKMSPLLLLSNIKLNSNLKLSQKMYDKLIQNLPMVRVISSYAKKEKNSVVFNIQLHNSKLSVNGKAIQ